MEILEIEGKKYVKASQAAKKAGYTSDYVGQLCRNGTIGAHLVGRSWYVDAEALAAHRVEKKRQSRIKAREHVKKAIEAEKQEIDNKTTPPEFLRHLHVESSPERVTYASDDRELIPSVKKPPEIQSATVPVTIVSRGRHAKPKISTIEQKVHKKSVSTPLQTARSAESVHRSGAVVEERTRAGVTAVHTQKWFLTLTTGLITLTGAFVGIFGVQTWTLQQGENVSSAVTVQYTVDMSSLSVFLEQFSNITMEYLSISEESTRYSIRNSG